MRNGRRRNIIPEPENIQRCPNCESNDIRITARAERYVTESRTGAEFVEYFESYRCNFCGAQMDKMIERERLPDAELERAQILNRPKCPKCRSLDVPATSTQGQKQYRKCRHCRMNFYTVRAD